MVKVVFIFIQLQFLIASVVASNSKYQIPYSRMDALVKSNRKYNLANNGPSLRFRDGWKRSKSREDLLKDNNMDDFVDQNQEKYPLDENQKILPYSWSNDIQRKDYMDQNQKKSSSSLDNNNDDDNEKALPSSWLQLSDFIPPYSMLHKPGRSGKKRSFTPHDSSRQGFYGEDAKTRGKNANNVKRDDEEEEKHGVGKVMMVVDDDDDSQKKMDNYKESKTRMLDIEEEEYHSQKIDANEESTFGNMKRGFGGYLGMKLKSWRGKENPYLHHSQSNKDDGTASGIIGKDFIEKGEDYYHNGIRAVNRPFINSRWG